MTKLLAYKNLETKDTKGQKVFSTDFASTLKISQNFKNDLIKSLALDSTRKDELLTSIVNITVSGEVSDIAYEITSGQGKFSVVKDGGESVVDIFTDISKVLEIDFSQTTLGNTVIDFGSQNVSSVDDLKQLIMQNHGKIFSANDFTSEKNKVSQELSVAESELKSVLKQEDNGKVERLKEVGARIKQLDSELTETSQKKKSKETYQKRQTELESGIANMEEKLKSVSDLLTVVDGLKKDLGRFGSLASDPGLRDKVKILKTKRIEKVLNKLMGMGSDIGNRLIRQERWRSTDVSLFDGKSVLFLLFLQLFLSIFYYLKSLKNEVIYSGFLGFLAILFTFLLINVVGSRPNSKSDVQFKTSGNLKRVFAGSEGEENKFFINAAWVNALSQELSGIEKMIAFRLQGKSYQVIEDELKKKKNDLETVKVKIDESNKVNVDSDDYLKKRRNLDILKIEKENLEAGVDPNILSKLKQVEEYELKLSQFEKANNTQLSLPLIFINIQLVKGDLRLWAKQALSALKLDSQVILVEVV